MFSWSSPIHHRTLTHLSYWAAPLLLGGCSLLNTAPVPSISAPLSEAAVAAVVPVTVRVEDDGEVTRVDLYARARGDTAPGVKVGGSTSSGGGGAGGDTSSGETQFTVSWNTAGLPNLSELEIYAVALDDGGLSGQSESVPLLLSSGAVPTLRYFASITLPPAPVAALSSTPGDVSGGPRDAALDLPLERGDLRPLEVGEGRSRLEPLTLQASEGESERVQVLEWAWNALSGATGYVTYLSPGTRLGGYLKQDRLAPEAASGLQKYSKLYPQASLQSRFYGTVRALNGGVEGGHSNTFLARFLEAQPPGTAANLSKGRPTLSWDAHPDPEVIGYYHWVYKKNPLLNPQEVAVWTNAGGRTTAKRSAVYPPERDALPRGKYFFWIAGVSFNPDGGASGFSFSELRSFEVK